MVAENFGVYTIPTDLKCTNATDYLFRGNYSTSNGKRATILKNLKKYISRDNKNPIMQHYLKDKNHIPPWILTTGIPYGLTIEWYNILKGNHKTQLCNTFISPGLLSDEQIKEFTRKAFDLTKEYRNKIAHGNRTFNMISLPQLPKEQTLKLTFRAISESEYDNRMGQNDTFAIILSLIVLLSDKYLISNFYSELYSVLMPYIDLHFNGQTIFDIFGFPNNIFERMQQLINQKFS